MAIEEPLCKDRFGRTLHVLDALLSKLENPFNLIAGSLVFGLMLLGVLQILMRTVFQSPIFGYLDIVELSMVGFGVLSIAYVQRLGGHVRMELVVQSLKGRWLWFVELVGSGLTAFIVVILIPGSYAHFQRAFEFGDSTLDIQLAIWPAKLVIPVALSLLLLRVMLQFTGYVRLLFNPSLDPVAIPKLDNLRERAKEEIAASRDSAV